MTHLQVLPSAQDASVNFVEEQLTGFLESRYVRKCPEYFIAYLSSQTGCNRGCAFCHLTVTGQTSFEDSTPNDFIGQALNVFKHYRREVAGGAPRADYMHYNLMARGEPLANRTLLDLGEELLVKLGQLARAEGLPAKFNVSTIMPRTLSRPLRDVFGFMTPTIYYSLYSVNPDFRAKWLPGAMPVDQALQLLGEYHSFSKKIIKIHHAFIENENDSDQDIDEMCARIDGFGLGGCVEFNLVRYNPASPAQGRESPEVLGRVLTRLLKKFPGPVKVIPRVGHDVKASCGMFVEGGES